MRKNIFVSLFTSAPFYRNFIKSKYAKLIVGVIVIFLILNIASNSIPNSNKTVKITSVIGTAGPSFKFSKINESEIDSQFEQKSPKTVVLFWQTWCNCMNILKDISNVPEVQNGTLRIIFVNSENADSTKYFIDKQSLDTKNAYYSFDNEGTAAKGFNVVKTPQLFYINNKKIIDTDIYFSDLNTVKSKISYFANDYKNTSDTNYTEGVRISVDQSKLKILCKSDEINDYSHIAPLPNPFKFKDDKAIDCIGDVIEPVFTGFDEKQITKAKKYIQVTIGESTHIYPIEYLTAHISVNDVLEGLPISVVFDPLSYSVNVFSRIIEGEVTTIGVSGRAYQHTSVLYDRKSNTFWYNGTGIYGKETGKTLERLPFTVLNGDQIDKNGLIMLPPTNLDYSKNQFSDFWNNDKFIYPLEGIENTKANKEVITVIPKDTVNLNSNIFSNNLGDMTLDFDVPGNFFTDKNTHSLWNQNGKCLQGVLRGSYLERQAIKYSMKFDIF